MNILRINCSASVRRALSAVVLEKRIGIAPALIESRSSLYREFLCESLTAVSWQELVDSYEKRKAVAIVLSGEILLRAVELFSRDTSHAGLVIAGFDGDTGWWSGGYWAGNETRHLDGLRMVCSSMPEIRSDVTGSSGNREDQVRYSRLAGAIRDVANRLPLLKVMVIGAGRNGSAILQQLALLGVGALTIVDRDILHTENLDATLGVGPSQVGLSKVRAVAELLCRMREDLSITCLEKSASHRDVLEAARTTDLIISCVDHDTPRLGAAKIARKLLRPHIDIGTGVTQQADGTRLIAGDARLLMPGDGCVCCVGGLRNRKDAEFELLSPPDALRRGKPVVWHQERMGSLITINSMTVSIGVQLWLDLLSGSLPGSTWHRIRWIEGQGLESHASPVGASAVCDICNRW